MNQNIACLFGLLLFLIQGCNPVNQTRDQVEGVESPFYQKTTFSLRLLDSNNHFPSQSHQNLYDIHLSLFKALLDGKIKGYEGNNLAEAYSVKKIRNRARVSGYDPPEQSLKNPKVRKNFLANIDRKRFIQYYVTLKWNWDIKDGKAGISIYNLKPIHIPSAGGVSLGKQHLCAIRYEDALKHLSEKQQDTLFSRIRQSIFNQLSQSDAVDRELSYQGSPTQKGVSFTKRALPFSNPHDSTSSDLERMFYQTHLKIYEKALAGSVKGFKNDSLKNYYSDSVLKMRGANREVIKYHPNPSDYRYKRDTVVYEKHDPEETRRYRILEKWKNRNKKGFTVKQKALSIAYRDERGGVILPPRDLFWIKMDELTEALPYTKSNWLKKFLLLKLQRKLSDKGFEF